MGRGITDINNWSGTAVWIAGTIALTAILLFGFAFWQTQGDKTPQVNSAQTQTQSNPTSQVKFNPINQISVLPQIPFDWGTVRMAKGKVQTSFTLKNESSSSAQIDKIETSCMCTEASIKVGEKTSPFFGMPGHTGNFGWQASLEPGKEAVLTVVFDPNAHGPAGKGKNDRVVRIFFSEPQNTYLDVPFTVNVAD